MKAMWFDGARDGLPVTVTAAGKALRLVDADGRERGEVAYEGAAVSIGGTDGGHLVLTHGEGPAARALFLERDGLLAALEGAAPDWFVAQVRALATARRVRWATTRSLLLALLAGVTALVVLLLVNLHALAVRAIPVEWEVAVGAQLWEQLAPAERPGVDPAAEAFVERTTLRLVDTHVRDLAARGQRWPYEVRVRVAPSAEVNAFALPGGYLIVNQGLLRAAGSPEEVAGVIAHELGHVDRRHTVKRAVEEVGSLTLLLLLFDPGTALTELRPLVSLVGLKNTRDAESEADAFGARLLHASGLDPGAMSSFFDRLARSDLPGQTALALLETHPASADRAATLRRLVDELGPRAPGAPLCSREEWAAIQAGASR